MPKRSGRLLSRRHVLGGMLGTVGGGLALAPLLRVGAAPPDVNLLSQLVVLHDDAVSVYAQLANVQMPAAAPAPAGSSPAPSAALLGAIGHFGDDHKRWRDALAGLLTSMGAQVPPVGLPHPDTLSPGTGFDTALTTILDVEYRVFGAEYGAIGAFSDLGLARSVAGMFAAVAQHVSVLRLARRSDPVPDALPTGPPSAGAAIGGRTPGPSSSAGEPTSAARGSTPTPLPH